MKNLKFLLERKASLVSEMDSIVKSAESEGMLSDEQVETFSAKKAELEKVKSQIDLLQGFDASAETQVTAVKSAPVYGSNHIPALSGKKEFDSLAEFMSCAIGKQDDPRLADCYRSEQSMGTGAKGGFLVPAQFINQIKSIDPSASLVRPRASVIPAGVYPDAEVSLPALDQGETDSDTNQMYAGVSVAKVEEGGSKPTTDVNYRLISLKPSEIAARIPMTDKILRNAPAVGTWAEKMLRQAVLAFEDVQFLRGNGVGGPTGIIDHASTYKHNRASGGNISFADVKAMYARWRGNSATALWVCSYGAFSELLDMTGDGGGATNIIKVDQSTGSISLYGIPVVRHDRGRALGSRGDLGLYDFSNYLIKDGSGPLVEVGYASGQWETNKRSIKITWNVDGSPWCAETFRDETDYEFSPFVVLAGASGS